MKKVLYSFIMIFMLALVTLPYTAQAQLLGQPDPATQENVNGPSPSEDTPPVEDRGLNANGRDDQAPSDTQGDQTQTVESGTTVDPICMREPERCKLNGQTPDPAATQTPTPGISGAVTNTPGTTNGTTKVVVPADIIINGKNAFGTTDFDGDKGIVSCGRERVPDSYFTGTAEEQQAKRSAVSQLIAKSCDFKAFMLFLQRLVNYALILATLLIVFAIGQTGVQYLQAGSKPGELSKLKTRLFDIAIGVFILLASWLIFRTLADYILVKFDPAGKAVDYQSYIYLIDTTK